MAMDNPFEAINLQLRQLQATFDLLAQRLNVVSNAPERPITMEEAAKILMMAPQTIYHNIDKIPHHKRNGRLYFFESELIDYIRTGSEKPAKTLLHTRPAKRKKAEPAS